MTCNVVDRWAKGPAKGLRLYLKGEYMKYVLLLLLCSGCASTPLELYMKHQKNGAEDDAKFQAEEAHDLATICVTYPERCSAPALYVSDCKWVQTSDNPNDKAQWCVMSERAKILTQKFWTIKFEKEYSSLDITKE